MRHKHIIFDFDGTMADSLLALTEITQQLAPIYHFQAITPNILPKLRTMSAQHILTYLHIKPWLVPILMITIRRRLRRKIPHMALQTGFDALLNKLPEHTASIGILSSNSKTNIYKFLSQHQLQQIDYVHVEKYKLSKQKALHRLLKKNKFQASDTCYVVDEVRDIEAAKTVGVTSVAVTWGYNNREALEQAKPDFLVDTPEELEKVLYAVIAALRSQ